MCSSGDRSWPQYCLWACRWLCSTIPSSTASSRASRAAWGSRRGRGRPRLGRRNRLLGLGLLHRIGTTGVTDVKHQVLDRLVRLVHEVVPPPAFVHVGLSRGMVLGTLDSPRPGLVVRG